MSQLIRLVYASKAEFKPSQKHIGNIELEVARILVQSKRNNPKKEIGGVLYYGDSCFFQCLEGKKEDVEELVVKLSMDARHSNVKVLDMKEIESRAFADWSMKYVATVEDVRRILLKHGLETFNPYVFDKNVINDLITLFSSLPDSPAHVPSNASNSKSKRGWWQRLRTFFK